MNKKRIFLIGAAVLLSLMSALLLTQEAIQAQDGKMILIYGTWEGDKAVTDAAVTAIEPQKAWVDKGTTVVWVNRSQSKVNIIFAEGKTCKLATSVAKGFRMDLDSRQCYITGESIEPGGSISAMFNNIGQYAYEVEYVDKNVKQKGMIEVRTKPGVLY